MNWIVFLTGAAGSFLLAWAFVGLWIRVSLRRNIVDVPTHRSSHTRATPRGGGVGIVVAVVAGVGVAVAGGRAPDVPGALVAGALALFIAAVSFVDDLRRLPSVLRLVCHVGAAVGAVYWLGSFPALSVPFLEEVVLPAWLLRVVGVVWIVGLTNVYNFMDGIDGIAGGQGVVTGLAWGWLGAVTGQPLVTWTGVTVAAACGGFLVHNWAPAKVFMGDVGAAFLGFVFAILPLIALRGHAGFGWPVTLAGGVPVFAALAVWPFVADGAFTFLRRIKHKENLLEAHRSHLYQRLTIAGWRHAPVTTIYVAWAAAMAPGAAVYLLGDRPDRLTVLVLAGLTLVAMYFFVKRFELRNPPASGEAPVREQESVAGGGGG